MRFEYGVIAAVGALVFASATAQTTHSPAALAEDLDQFLQVVESTHPDIGYTASLAELRAKKDEIRSGLAQPLDARNAWLRFARLNPLFRDAHVGLQYPVNEFTAYRQSGGAVFPCRFISTRRIVCSCLTLRGCRKASRHTTRS